MKEKIPVVELEDVSKIYQMGHTSVRALNKVRLKINRGEYVAVLGRSGSGKSTLLHMMGILDVPTSGKIYIDGKEVSQLSEDERARIRGKKIGFVFQTFNLIPSLNALENAAIPMMIYGVSKAEREKRARELLEKLGLGERLLHKPSELSGGERQRVAIARALANQPEVILADEPTGNLDSKSRHEVVEIFTKLNKEGKTIVVVTHDEDIAEHAKRIVKIKDGEVKE
ncbi:MAG: ABC transporter ATP-binding protein [Candidatus Anstonellales archaeon]